MTHYTPENTICIGKKAKVFVDGIQQNECLGCDPDEGWADIFCTSPDGMVLLENGELKTERLTGAVIIEWVGHD